MKKTLIALAVAGVVAAPAAMADVTVYGQGHISVGTHDNGKDSVTAVDSNSSRFGLKAAESLDGGLTAVAQMEFGVAMDDGGAVSGRNQFVGLAGGFGTILAGRHDAPIKMSTGALDIFADTVADYNNIIGVNGAADVRADNAIAYVAPAIGGATIVAAYVPESAKSAKDNAQTFAVMWGQGPLSIDFGYLSTGKGYDLTKTAGGVVKEDLSGVIAAQLGAPEGTAITAEISTWRLGAGYAVSDSLKVAAIYEHLEAKNPALKGWLDTDTIKFNDYLVNAAFSIGGGNTLKAEYGVMQNDTSNWDKGNSTLMAVGFDHAFSKNVNGYVVYANMANDENARARLGVVGSGANIAPADFGKDPSSIEVGMVVKF